MTTGRAHGHGARLVEDQRVDLGGALEEIGALDEDAQSRGDGHRRHDGGGTGDEQGRRGRHDQHGDRSGELLGEEEGRGRQGEHQGQPDARAALEKAQHRNGGALHLRKQLHHAPQHGVGTRTAHLDLEQSIERHRSGEHRATGRHVLVEGLAGDRRLVHRGPPLDHRAVHRDPLSRTHEDLVAGLEIVGIDPFLLAAAPPHRLPGRQRADPVDCGSRTERAPLLEQAPDLEEEGNEGRGDESTARRRGEDGDRDQLIGGPPRVPGDDAPHTRHERRDSHHRRGEGAAELADLPLARLDPHQQGPQGEQPQRDEPGPEPNADAAAFLGSE